MASAKLQPEKINFGEHEAAEHDPNDCGPRTAARQSLRRQAEDWLTGRSPLPPARDWEPGVEALALLYSLANNAATSPDALKLLHELQVRQIEFTLQHEQAEKASLEQAALARDADERNEFAPVGYLTLDADDRIVAANDHACRLLGAETHSLIGRELASCFDSKRSGIFLPLLGSRPVTVVTPAPASRQLQLVTKAAADGNRTFVGLLDCADWVGKHA